MEELMAFLAAFFFTTNGSHFTEWLNKIQLWRPFSWQDQFPKLYMYTLILYAHYLKLGILTSLPNWNVKVLTNGKKPTMRGGWLKKWTKHKVGHVCVPVNFIDLHLLCSIFFRVRPPFAVWESEEARRAG